VAGRPSLADRDRGRRSGCSPCRVQDPARVPFAVRARTEGLTAAESSAALSEERSLVVTWLNRGTLHLVRSEDYPWLQALTTPPCSPRARGGCGGRGERGGRRAGP
jgi:hypothetical protein